MTNKIKKLIAYVGARYYLKKPEQQEFIETRYSSLKSLFDVGLNQFFYMIKSPHCPKITSIQFEVTNSCNLKCKMCPVNNGMKREKGFMDFNLFKKVLDENPKVELVQGSVCSTCSLLSGLGQEGHWPLLVNGHVPFIKCLLGS